MASIRRVFAMFLLAGVIADTYAAEPTPSASLYQSDVALTDQNDRVLHLADLRDESVLVSIFYTSCRMVYPMILETIRTTLAKSGRPARDGVRAPMVTVDPKRDSVAALRKTTSVYGTDGRWQVTRTDASDMREVAVLLGVQY